MLKLKNIFLFALLLSAYSCANNRLWVKVRNDINSKPLNIKYIETKFSPIAIKKITNGQGDTIRKITDFFNSFNNRKDYKIEKQADTRIVIFNPDDMIADGLFIFIKGTTDNWYITDIRFGK